MINLRAALLPHAVQSCPQVWTWIIYFEYSSLKLIKILPNRFDEIEDIFILVKYFWNELKEEKYRERYETKMVVQIGIEW